MPSKEFESIAEKMVRRRLLDREDVERYASLPFQDEGFGYDLWGYSKETGLEAFAYGKWMYKRYHRVTSVGHENIPPDGRAIMAANHSGVLPIDGIMISMDTVLAMDPPRQTRAIVERYFSGSPFIGPLIHRVGMVTGTRRDFEELLNREELVLVFPEGTKGIGKTFNHRYQCVRFNVGFVEIALEFKAPVIPVAVVGGEEQAPMLANLSGLAKRLNMPYFPVTPTFPLLGPLGILPLPTKYYIYYGKPIALHDEYPLHALRDTDAIREMADRVQGEVQKMMDAGVEERAGIFF